MHSVKVAGIEIPAIGLGTWRLSGEDCARMVAEALRLGYRHIDTAAAYDNEREAGRGLKAAGIAREQVFVTTKVWRDDLSASGVQRSAEASLKRLGLDHLDLLLAHWPNPAFPLKETIGALCKVKRAGLARAIGVANYPSALFEEAVALSDEPIVTNQVEYHPGLSQRRVLDAARRHDSSVTAYSPLARGRMMDDRVIREVAAAHRVTPSQVMLRWLVQQPQVIAIPKTAHIDRARENLDVFGFELTEAEMEALAALARPDGRTLDPGFAPEWDRD